MQAHFESESEATPVSNLRKGQTAVANRCIIKTLYTFLMAWWRLEKGQRAPVEETDETP